MRFLCFSFFLLAIRATWTKSCNSSQTADDILKGVDLNGKVILTTGADGHISTSLQQALGGHNASLILACHSQNSCDKLKAILLNASVRSDQIQTEILDLASFQSIREVASKMSKVDVLINMAALHEGGDSFDITKDGFTEYMQVNFIGAVLLSNLLLPILKEKKGRIINIGGAIYGFSLPNNTTVDMLESWCKTKTPLFASDWFAFAKFLLIHYSIELAKREPEIVSLSLNPGYVVEKSTRSWAACHTNFKYLQSCPETAMQSSSVISASALWDFTGYSGSYLDFKTKNLGPNEPNLFGQWQQSDPTCVPRDPPSMDAKLRSEWYDRLMQLIQ